MVDGDLRRLKDIALRKVREGAAAGSSRRSRSRSRSPARRAEGHRGRSRSPGRYQDRRGEPIDRRVARRLGIRLHVGARCSSCVASLPLPQASRGGPQGPPLPVQGPQVPQPVVAEDVSHRSTFAGGRKSAEYCLWPFRQPIVQTIGLCILDDRGEELLMSLSRRG